jgi:hypothetical protein
MLLIGYMSYGTMFQDLPRFYEEWVHAEEFDAAKDGRIVGAKWHELDLVLFNRCVVSGVTPLGLPVASRSHMLRCSREATCLAAEVLHQRFARDPPATALFSDFCYLIFSSLFRRCRTFSELAESGGIPKAWQI